MSYPIVSSNYEELIPDVIKSYLGNNIGRFTLIRNSRYVAHLDMLLRRAGMGSNPSNR
jgi:hypothetical protein